MRLRTLGLTVMLLASACSSTRTADPGFFPMPQMPVFAPCAAEQPDLAFRNVVGQWEFLFDDSARLAVSHSQVYRNCAPRLRWSLSGECTAGGSLQVVEKSITFDITAPTDCGALEARTDTGRSALLGNVTRWHRSGDQLLLLTASGQGISLRTAPVGDRFDDGRRVVVPRVQYLDEEGFLLTVQEQQDSDMQHGDELVNWIVASPGTSDAAGRPRLEVGQVSSANTWTMRYPGVVLRPQEGSASIDASPGSCVLADLNSYHGQNPASLRMRTLADRVQLVVDEEQSARASDGHVDEVVGYLAGDCHTGATELGRVEGVTSDWRRVILEGSFLDPVVVAGPATYNGADPGVVEVRKVTSDSFEIRFREWDYLDGQHQTAEDVFYLVAERGEAKLASGLVVEAGVAPATSAWSFVDLRAEFPSQPALFTTVVG